MDETRVLDENGRMKGVWMNVPRTPSCFGDEHSEFACERIAFSAFGDGGPVVVPAADDHRGSAFALRKSSPLVASQCLPFAALPHFCCTTSVGTPRCSLAPQLRRRPWREELWQPWWRLGVEPASQFSSFGYQLHSNWWPFRFVGFGGFLNCSVGFEIQ